MSINEKLRSRRTELGLTLDEVARMVNVSGATISRWESGDIENMKRDKIVLLANALQVSPAFIMEWDESGNYLEEDENLIILNRVAKRMTPENKKKLLEMAKLMFKEDFDD